MPASISQPPAGRSLIREQLTSPKVQPPLRLSFLELQANHAFIRDELSKVRRTRPPFFCQSILTAVASHLQGRFDAAISGVCFSLLLETFSRTIGRDLGERVVRGDGDDKLVC